MSDELQRRLINRENMTEQEMIFFLRGAIDEILSEADKIKILTLQNAKGISAEEIAAAVRYLRKNADKEANQRNAIDICGTGGSGLPRINTSTLAAFVLAALGVKIAKHGNRAAGGRFGSFDLLEALGITIDLTPAQSHQMVDQLGIGFFFAPKCYPEMASFAAARKAIGAPTMFNLLGPLLSPSNPRRQMIGTSSLANAKLLVEAAKNLGREKVYIIVGDNGLDEVSPTGDNQILLLDGSSETLGPADFGLDRCSFEDIAGGDRATNLRIAEEFLSGKNAESPHANLVHINVALALRLADREPNLKQGLALSRKTVRGGEAKAILEKVREMSRRIGSSSEVGGFCAK